MCFLAEFVFSLVFGEPKVLGASFSFPQQDCWSLCQRTGSDAPFILWHESEISTSRPGWLEWRKWCHFTEPTKVPCGKNIWSAFTRASIALQPLAWTVKLVCLCALIWGSCMCKPFFRCVFFRWSFLCLYWSVGNSLNLSWCCVQVASQTTRSRL